MENELEQMRIRLAEMAAEVERLSAVIDEANAQRPVALYDVQMTDNFRWISGGFLCRAKQGDGLYERPVPARQEPRITEQDFIEIIKSYMHVLIPFKVTFESWMSAEGSALLNKLNSEV